LLVLSFPVGENPHPWSLGRQAAVSQEFNRDNLEFHNCLNGTLKKQKSPESAGDSGL
jgi:hypothetical protein